MDNKLTVNKVNEIVKNEKGVFDLYTADQHTTEITNRVTAMKGIGDAIKAALVEGINNDYSTIPGTNKPTLLQPGARKVALLFGLVPEYIITHKDVNYDTKWVNKVKSKDGNYYNFEISGHFEYEITVYLRTNKGTTVSVGVGSCCNREKGKSDMPANSILKMAKKRAFVDAVLGIADLASVFTQDLEDINKTNNNRPINPYKQ